MPIVSPQIKQGKQNRQDFIDYLTSLMPATQMPPPPGMPYATPATWQEGLRPVVDMLVPQPEDTLMGLAKPFFIRFTKTPKADVKRGYSHVATSPDKEYLKELNEMTDNKYEIVKFGQKEYGLKTRGLNGYGPYDTIEEAIESAKDMKANINFNSEPWMEEPLHIFSGSYLGDDGMGYDIFDAIRYIKEVK